MNNEATAYKGLNKFITNIYLWVMLGLMISAGSAYVMLNYPPLLRLVFGNAWGVWVVYILQLILSFSFKTDFSKLEQEGTTTLSIIKYVVYAALTGVTFTVLTATYTSASIVQAFVCTIVLFAGLSIYGFTTKRDLSGLRSILFPALFGIIIVSLLNVFLFRSSVVDIVLSIITMIVFIGFTVYDTQKIKQVYHIATVNFPNAMGGLTILMALELYLDFINLFINLLRIIGDRR